jgi:hypothetical protein
MKCHTAGCRNRATHTVCYVITGTERKHDYCKSCADGLTGLPELRAREGIMSTGFTKIAWRRDPSVPAGQPALGHFNCPCGNVIEDVEFGGPDNHECKCGRVWDGRGWLVSENGEQS